MVWCVYEEITNFRDSKYIVVESFVLTASAITSLEEIVCSYYKYQNALHQGKIVQCITLFDHSNQIFLVFSMHYIFLGFS